MLVVTAFVSSLLNKGSGGPETSQESRGPHSPNYGSVQGGVHNYYPPTPAEGPQILYPPLGQKEADWRESHEFFSHDMPLSAVVQRVQQTLPSPSDEKEGELARYEGEIDQMIADAAYNRRMHTWGRKPGGRLKSLPREAWEYGKLDHQRGRLRYRHPDNLTSLITYIDLTFNSAEVNDWLPPSLDPRGMIA